MGNHNAHRSTTDNRFERMPVKCHGCKQPFDHFVYEVIDGLTQLRCGNVLLSRAEMMCIHCGRVFYWNLRDGDLERLVTYYKRVLDQIKPYVPE